MAKYSDHGEWSRAGTAQMSPRSMVWFPALFVVIGLAVLVFAVKGYIKSEGSRTWPMVKGRVLSSEVQSKSDSDGTTYGPDVVYEYTAAGAQHKGSRVHLMDGSSSDIGYAQKLVHRFPAGAEVEVYVNPADPYESVLVPGPGLGSWVLLIVGAMFTLIGGFMTWAIWNSCPQKAAPPASDPGSDPPTSVPRDRPAWQRTFGNRDDPPDSVRGG